MGDGRTPRRFTLKRFFLWRRAIDPLLLSLAAMTFLLPGNLAIWVFGVFLGIGLYLIAARHRSIRRVDWRYAAAAGILGVGSLFIHLANGSLPEDFRWATYPFYYLAAVPLAVGFVLVRDPLKSFVLGARVGIVLVIIWSLYVVAVGEYRFDLGSNAANAAFAITFFGVISRIDIVRPPKLLASRRLFFYLAAIAVLGTSTRATVAVFAVGFMLDLIALAQRTKLPWRGTPKQLVAAVVLFAAVLAPGTLLVPLVTNRAQQTVQEVTHFLKDPHAASNGLSIRVMLWRSAATVIAQHPITGIGGVKAHDALQLHIPAEQRTSFDGLSFSHNFILDEGMQRGITGIVLLLGFYVFAIAHIARRATPDIRENLALAAVLIVTFGMLHHLLLVDRHVAMIAIYFILLITDNRMRSLRRRWQA